MTERYPFSVDRQLVPNMSVDGSVVWTQSTIDSVNATLSDTINEGYVTAEEDNTQYLSILDSTGEITLDNLNITLANPKLEVEESVETFITTENAVEQVTEEVNEQQVVVYTVEGSDELFGIQIAQDEDGNFQKYQFQFRKNEDGQLEAIPETVQLLPMDEEVQEEVPSEILEQPQDANLGGPVFVQQEDSSEHALVDSDAITEEHEHDESTVVYEEQEAEVEEPVDVKPALLSFQNVKQEIQESQLEEFQSEDQMNEEMEEAFQENLPSENQFSVQIKQQRFEEDDETESMEYLENPVEDDLENRLLSTENSNTPETGHEEINVEYQENFNGHTQEYAEELEENPEDDYEHVEVNPDLDLVNSVEPTDDNLHDTEDVNSENNINDSDVEDFQIVEGLHITGDIDEDNAVPLENNENLERTSPVINSTNILRRALKSSKDISVKKDNRVFLYVVQHPEKENVDSLSMEVNNVYKPVRTNPRSILKSSYTMLQGKNQNQNENAQVEEKLNNRRFARGKEAMQARIFNNFISRTTIPQAPVRKDRLPRKQKIKPVERMDEEIVVQEVMVSSNGFVEAVDGGGFNKENHLRVMDYVELTDSDDDYDPRSKNKKKKKHKKRVEITISDSESSADSVIELVESDDENKEEEQKVPQSPKNASDKFEVKSLTKRRRGRPPKNRKSTETESSAVDLDSPMKKMRLESSESTEKIEIPCPKCDKSFPSQNSLKTHLQHHNLQSSLKNSLPADKYKCEDCESTFKNNALLTRHVCTKKYSCPVCKKKFAEQSSLSLHKRMHAKEQLIKTTLVPARVSPKKIKPASSPNVFKSPKKVTTTFKCKVCSKMCSSMLNLNSHMKTHKEFSCGTCSASFFSKLALEKHMRESCMKLPQSHRRSMRIKSLGHSSDESSNESTAGSSRLTRSAVKMNCDQCPRQFYTLKAMSQHKVKDHGLNTPAKSTASLSEGKSSSKVTRAHSGIPAGEKLRNAYAGLKCALDFLNNE